MKTFIENKKYLVSEKGEVYSTQLLGNQSQARLRKLRPSKHKSGYLYVTLSDNEGNKRKIFVHRIVALTYIDNPQNKEFVNHIDGDKMNNNVDNLEWVTRRENMIHARDVLGCNFNKNIKPIYQYDLNGNFIKRYESLKEVSERFKRDMSDIRRVCNGDRGRLYAYNYIWSYEDKKYTDEELKKIHKSLKNNNNRKATINQYTLDGELIHTYASLKEAIETNSKLAKSSLAKACVKECEYKGYKWSYGEL